MGADQKSNEDSTTSPVASDLVTELNGYDVLLGRSVPKWKCPGNGIFRKLIANHGDEYRSLNKHVYKDEIARRILMTIRALEGRFLRQIDPSIVRDLLHVDTDTEAWVVVDEETSLLKIKQALRDLPCHTKSPSSSTSRREDLEADSQKISIEERSSVEDIQRWRYAPSIPSVDNGYNQSIGFVPFHRHRPTTKMEKILAYRKNEYMRFHKLTISTQLKLLKQHQGQRVDQVMKRQRCQARARGVKEVPGDSSRLMAGCVKKIYVR